MKAKAMKKPMKEGLGGCGRVRGLMPEKESQDAPLRSRLSPISIKLQGKKKSQCRELGAHAVLLEMPGLEGLTLIPVLGGASSFISLKQQRVPCASSKSSSGNEEEGSVEDRYGQACEVSSLQWREGGDG